MTFKDGEVFFADTGTDLLARLCSQCHPIYFLPHASPGRQYVYSCTHRRTQTHALVHSQAHANARTRALTGAPKRARARTCTRMHMHTHKHANAHAHAYAQAFFGPSRSLRASFQPRLGSEPFRYYFEPRLAFSRPCSGLFRASGALKASFGPLLDLFWRHRPLPASGKGLCSALPVPYQCLTSALLSALPSALPRVLWCLALRRV